MDLIGNLLQGAGPGVVKEIAQRFGIDESMATSAIGALAPALQNFGGDTSQAAAHAAQASGLDAGLLGQLAPVLQGLLGGGQSGILGAVTNMLDADKDGSAVDDILGMAQKAFGKE